MKKLILASAMLCAAVISRATFTGFSTELVAADAIPGQLTWRVYANFDDPGDQLIAFYGFDQAPLILNSNTTFYQDPFGAALSTGIVEAFFPSFPTLAYDSWLTIAFENSTANSLNTAGLDLTTFESGGNTTINDIVGGSMFLIPGDPAAFPVDGKVLLAQLTSDGDIDYQFNIQWRDALGNTTESVGVLETISNAIPGCTDPDALNYNAQATEDDGSCQYPAPSFSGLSYELVASDGVTGFDTYRVYANFTNPLDQLIAVFGDNVFPLSISTSGTFFQSAFGGDFSSDINPAFFPSFPELEYDTWLTIGSEAAPNQLQTANMDAYTAPFEAGGALSINDPTGGAWFLFPDLDPDALPDAMGRVLIAQLSTDGFVDMTVNLQYRAQDGTNPQETGIQLSFPPMVDGCTDPAATNYDPTATVDDGSCFYAGCTYVDADNYDPIATTDDGSCVFSGGDCPGCTDPTAFNYDADATIDDGSCIAVVNGCTDATATNYDAAANTDDGSCIATVFGCTDNTAVNFDPAANTDNGGCIAVRPGCTDPSAGNYNPYANTDDGSCDFTPPCPEDLNGDGEISTGDILELLGAFGTPCPSAGS